MKNTKISKITSNQYLPFLLAIFFLTRILFLKSLPIFNDEAIYIDWGWRMINIKGALYYSIAQDKPPLFMWILGILRKIITDPLIAGRIVSIFAGFLSLVGIYKLAENIVNKKVALLSAFFYTITSLFLFFDRQALMESSVSAVGIWTFYFFHKLVKYQNLKYSFLLGLTLGAGYLIKTNAILFALPIIFFFLAEIKYNPKTQYKLINHAFISFLSLLIIVSPLLLNSTFWQNLSKNKDYIFTFSELIKFPVTSWLNNFKNFATITSLYLNPLLILSAFTSICQSIKTKDIDKIYLTIYLFCGWFLVILLSRSVIPRHIVSFLPITLIFAADSFFRFYKKAKLWSTITLSVITIPFIALSLMLIIKPIKYFYTLDNISAFSLKDEYITHWSSGYGVDGVVNYLKNEANTSPVIVGVRLDAGNPENAIFAYFQNSKNIIPIYLDSRMIKNFKEFDCINSKIPVYFVSRDENLAGLNKHLTEIKRFYKPEAKHFIGIHKVITECKGEKILNLN